MATYLITGGAGFIGCNLARSLLRDGHTVRILDDFSTGRHHNIADIQGAVEIIEGDVREASVVQSACRGDTFVLHHAAVRAVEHSVDDPRLTNDTNVTGTLNVLMAARDQGVRRVVFASSSAVYGEATAAQQNEEHHPAPASPYAVSKLTGEHYCRVFSQLYSLETVSLRYFNVFGPYQSPESRYANVIPLLVSALLAGHAPEIHWDGEQSRDFVYIDDVVQANRAAVSSHHSGAGHVYNIGAGRDISINELYRNIQEVLGVVIEPRYTGKRSGDVRRTRADIARARRDLGYEPRVSFFDGLTRSLQWYQTALQSASDTVSAAHAPASARSR